MRSVGGSSTASTTRHQTSPAASADEIQNALSALSSVVSRVGIEPTTRRLRVASVKRKRSKF
jgi:hypothetical protein